MEPAITDTYQPPPTNYNPTLFGGRTAGRQEAVGERRNRMRSTVWRSLVRLMKSSSPSSSAQTSGRILIVWEHLLQCLKSRRVTQRGERLLFIPAYLLYVPGNRTEGLMIVACFATVALKLQSLTRHRQHFTARGLRLMVISLPQAMRSNRATQICCFC